MNRIVLSLFLFFVLLCTPVFSAEMAEGTVIFFKNGFFSRPIARHTGSHMCHVAIVLYEDGRHWAYEAAPGGVQRTLLSTYLEKTVRRQRFRRSLEVYYVQPDVPYTGEELAKMKKYANSHIGRPYSLRGWLVNREVIGMHCSHYVGDMISQTGRINSAHWKESPISLYRKLTE